MHSISGRKSGFTLIELLVVIAIIAILAAILFPVFAAAREKARQTTCASNEKQLGLAFIQYVQDYDEYWPVGVTQQNSQSNHCGQGWATSIYPYVKATGVYTCPDDPTQVSPGNTAVSYAYNYNVFNQSQQGSCCSDTTDPAYMDTFPLGKFNAPAVTVLLAEWQMQGGGGERIGSEDGCGVNCTVQGGGIESAFEVPGWDSQCAVGAGCNAQNGSGNNFIGGLVTGQLANVPVSLGNNSGNYAQIQPGSSGAWYLVQANVQGGVHTGGSNFLFCDGHVKWLRGTSVLGGQNSSSPSVSPGTSSFSAPIVATFSII